MMFHTSHIHVPRNRRPSALRTFIASSSFGPPDSKEPLRRGILLTAVAFVLLLIGSILTWLGFNDVFGGRMSMTGPLLIALSLLLLLLSFRQFLLARKRSNTNNRSSMQLDSVNRESVTAVVVNGDDGLHPATIIVDSCNPIDNRHFTVHRSWEEDSAPPSYHEVTRFSTTAPATRRSLGELHNTPCPPHHPRHPHHHHYQHHYQDELPPTYEETMESELYSPLPHAPSLLSTPPAPTPIPSPAPSLQSPWRSPVVSLQGVSREGGDVSQSNVTVLSPLAPVEGKPWPVPTCLPYVKEQGGVVVVGGRMEGRGITLGNSQNVTLGNSQSGAMVAAALAVSASQHAPPLSPLLFPPPSQRMTPSPPPPSPLRQLSAPPSPHPYFSSPTSGPLSSFAGSLIGVSPRASCLQLSPYTFHPLPPVPCSSSSHFSAPSSPHPRAGPPPSPHSHTPPPLYTSCPPSPPVLRQLSAPPSPHPFLSHGSPGFASSPPPLSLTPPLTAMHPLALSPRSQPFSLPPSSLMGHPLPASPHLLPQHTGSGSSGAGQEGYACFTYSFLTPPPSILPHEATLPPPSSFPILPSPSQSIFTHRSLVDCNSSLPHASLHPLSLPGAGFEGEGHGRYLTRAVPGVDVGGMCNRPDFQGPGAGYFHLVGRDSGGETLCVSSAQEVSQTRSVSGSSQASLPSRTDIQASV